MLGMGTSLKSRRRLVFSMFCTLWIGDGELRLPLTIGGGTDEDRTMAWLTGVEGRDSILVFGACAL